MGKEGAIVSCETCKYSTQPWGHSPCDVCRRFSEWEEE